MIWAAMLLVLAPAAMVRAEEIRFPALTGRVVDDAHMLSADQQAELSANLKALQDKNGRQLVVVTLPSLQGLEIEDFGVQLGRKWGIGQKGQNNGVLFLVAPAEHKVRIEVGYGLEDVLTDALSSVIIQEKVLPKFRSGDMPGGIVDGANALTEQLGLDDQSAHARVVAAQPVRRIHHTRSNPLGAIFTLFIVYVVISSLFGRGRGIGGWFWPLLFLSSMSRGGRSDWGDSGGGGWGGGGDDNFGGGGGSFGGGGSSGSW